MNTLHLSKPDPTYKDQHSHTQNLWINSASDKILPLPLYQRRASKNLSNLLLHNKRILWTSILKLAKGSCDMYTLALRAVSRSTVKAIVIMHNGIAAECWQVIACCFQLHKRQWSAECSTLRLSFKKNQLNSLLTEILPCCHAIDRINPHNLRFPGIPWNCNHANVSSFKIIIPTYRTDK